jgi:hypothetical protein
MYLLYYCCSTSTTYCSSMDKVESESAAAGPKAKASTFKVRSDRRGYIRYYICSYTVCPIHCGWYSILVYIHTVHHFVVKKRWILL